MNILEKELEDLVFETLQSGKVDLLVKRGLRNIGKFSVISRQLALGDYGRLDMVGFNYDTHNQTIGRKRLEVGIFELKKGEINFETLKQAMRYCKGIQHYLDDTMPIFDIDFTITLIGTSICKSDFVYLADYMDMLTIYTTKLDLEKGITFQKESHYKIIKAKLPTENSQVENSIKRMILNKIKTKVTGVNQSTSAFSDFASIFGDDDQPF